MMRLDAILAWGGTGMGSGFRPSDSNPAAPTQVGTGGDGQPIYQGNLNDGSSWTNTGAGSSDDEAQEDGQQAGGDTSADGPGGAPIDQVDTGDATFIGAESAPNEDVIPITGDSTSEQEQIYADPGLGDRGDPPPPPPQPPEPRPVIDDDVRRAANQLIPEEYLAPNVDLNARAPTPSPLPIIPIVVAAVVLIGAVVGFAATRPSSGQTDAATVAPAPLVTVAPQAPATSAATATPVATVPVAAPRVTDTKITEQGNVCLNQTTFIFTATVVGAKAGDSVHLKITGPGLPSEASGTLGADGTVSGVIGVVGPVKGNQSWSAQVDQIAGKPIVSGPSQVFGFCPTS